MILADTNVVSEALSLSPEPAVVRWLNQHFSELAISTVSVLELHLGTKTLRPGRRRDALEDSIAKIVRRFGPRVIPFDLEAAHAAARLLDRARATGKSLHQIPAKLADLQIAGIAVANGLDLATRDIGDFAGLGLKLIDPWTDS